MKTVHLRLIAIKLSAINVMAAMLSALALAPCTVTYAAQPASSAATLYGVEIIVFRASSPGAEEDWNTPMAGRGFGSSANRGGATPTVVKILEPAEYRMNAIEASLKSSGAWHPLAHAAWIQTAPTWGAHTGLELSDLGINVPGLTGTVYVERAPIYIHLGFDVQYQAGATYTIKEMRSVKYNEKQYFDHPAFGIIALVTPIKHIDASETH